MGSCTLTVVASQTKHEILCCCPCLRGLCLCCCCPSCLQRVRLPLRLWLHRRRPCRQCGCLPSCCPSGPGRSRELCCRPCCLWRSLCRCLRSLSRLCSGPCCLCSGPC